MADHSWLVLVNTPHMSARTAVVAEVRVRILSYVRQIDARVLRAARWAIGYCCHVGQVLLQQRGVQFVWKCRDVVDQIRVFFVHGPDVPALGTTVVVSAGQFARERQRPARSTVTRWTGRDRDHGWGTTHYPSEMAVALSGNSRTAISVSAVSGRRPLRYLAKDPALMIRADSTAPVFNDEEKLAHATTQAHKAARDGYRFDVGTFAIWAGCDRATTLVAGARHVGTASARNVPAEPQTFRAKLRGVGAGCKTEVVGSDPFRQPWWIAHGPTEVHAGGRVRKSLAYRSGTAFRLCTNRRLPG